MTESRAHPAAETAAPVRVYYFDYLRVWATVGVVTLHSAWLIILARQDPKIDVISHFNVANIYDSMGRFAVSCFFMISGALLLDPGHRFRLRQQTLRVLVPLVTWSAIYAAFDAYFAVSDLPVVSGSDHRHGDVWGALKAFLSGPLAYHLWFVYVLVGIYLVVPLLRPLTALPAMRRDRLLRYALSLWLIFTILLPVVHHFWPGAVKLNSGAYPDFPSGYLGVFILGFYLHHHGLRIRPAFYALGALVGVTATCLVVYFEQTFRDGSFWAYSNLTPNVVVFAASVFLLAKTYANRPGRWFGFFSRCSALSFRVYLLHVLVLHYLRAISPLR
ncbi:MAG: hypothetical protein JWQ70_638, partial [Aeromicrobium sp.]|nr:hypothetical protein [Aeromicrobium sp.]